MSKNKEELKKEAKEIEGYGHLDIIIKQLAESRSRGENVFTKFIDNSGNVNIFYSVDFTPDSVYMQVGLALYSYGFQPLLSTFTMPIFCGVWGLSLLWTFLYSFGVALWLHLNDFLGGI